MTFGHWFNTIIKYEIISERVMPKRSICQPLTRERNSDKTVRLWDFFEEGTEKVALKPEAWNDWEVVRVGVHVLSALQDRTLVGVCWDDAAWCYGMRQTKVVPRLFALCCITTVKGFFYAHGHPEEICQQELTGARRASRESLSCSIAHGRGKERLITRL